MAPPTRSRPLSLAIVLLICVAILSARVLLGHTRVEATAPSPDVQSSSEHSGELPPVW
jgi:hypothetical protein